MLGAAQAAKKRSTASATDARKKKKKRLSPSALGGLKKKMKLPWLSPPRREKRSLPSSPREEQNKIKLQTMKDDLEAELQQYTYVYADMLVAMLDGLPDHQYTAIDCLCRSHN